MFAKTITAALVSTALLATVASAQTPTDRSNSASSTVSSSTLQGDWRASKVVGLKVYNDNNESLGSINDLVMDKSGNIKAVVLGVGGFLGVGEHLIAVPLDKIKFSNEPVSYTSVSSNAPNAGTSRPASSTTTGSAANPPAATSKPNPWYPDHAMLNATKDELKNMPEFKYSTE